MLDPALTPTRLVNPGERPAPRRVTGTFERGAGSIAAVLAGWILAELGLRLLGRLTPAASARRVTALLERFGGLWIKAGQLLALRVDLFSAELCRELGTLETRGTAFPAQEARQIVEDALGAIDQTFETFESEPFAATWISQVHRARLKREGTWVAVKVQHPGVARAFARDLRVMRWVTTVFRWLRFYPSVRWERALQELEQIAREESDFRFEAAAIRRLRRNLPRRRIVVPQLFPQYCRSRVLVTEFIHAALMSDLIWLRSHDPDRLARWLAENRIEPRLLARRLIQSFLRQVFEDNFYHGALYPGNIVLLRDSRVALLQFGSCGFTEREYLHKLYLFFRALATRDYDKAADLALLLCGQLPAIPIEDVKEELVRGLRTWTARTFVSGLPYDEKSIDNATVGVTRTLFAYGCPLDWGFLRVRRALTILDSSLEHLDPDINYTKLCSTYFRKAERRTLVRSLGTPLAARAAGSVIKAFDLQDRLAEYSLFQGGLIRRHAQVFQGATDKLSDLTATILGQLAVVVVAAGALFAAAFIEQQRPGAISSVAGPALTGVVARMPPIGPGPWVLVLGVTSYVFWTLWRLRRRFRQKDVRAPSTQTTA